MAKKAFSLIEVLVFISILSLFFVAAMAVATFSLKNMKNQEYKIIATHLAEEAMEWVKSEKETDWSIFSARDTGNGTTYCLKNLDSTVWNTQGQCPDYSLGTPAIFKRELLIDNQAGSPATTIDVEITVSWLEAGSILKVPIKAVLSVLE